MKNLHEVAREACLSEVRRFCRRGAEVNALREGGLTPLHDVTLLLGDPDVAACLLEHGADARIADAQGRTPLHYAAGMAHLAVAALLLDHGADVNATENWGETPLHWAALEGHVDMVDLLLTRGADPMLADAKGETAWDWAVAQGHADVVERLEPLVRRRRHVPPPLVPAGCR